MIFRVYSIVYFNATKQYTKLLPLNKLSMLQPNDKNSRVLLLNCYTRANFNRFACYLRDSCRSIDVEDVRKTCFACFKNLNISKTKQDMEKLKTPIRLF